MSPEPKEASISFTLNDPKHKCHVTATVDWWSLVRLTRLHLFPIGSDVCMAPSLWGVLMAARHDGFESVGTVIWLLVLWSFGETIAHSAGCVLNDILDRDVDGLVERSRDRPLASGSVTLRQAICLTISLHAITLYVFSRGGFPALCAGLVQIVFFGWTYPLMKRWTCWPQAWLGITFGWGILKGWLSFAGGKVDVYVVGALWCGNVCWTIVYDTIYACQDRKDDTRAGVKSTAVLFGDYVGSILSLFATAFVLCLCIAGVLNGQGVWYFVVSVGGAACHLAWQLCTVDFDDKRDCMEKFKSNGSLGFLVSVGLLLDYLF